MPDEVNKMPVSYTDEYKKGNKLLYRYGITFEMYNQLFDKQKGKCAICKKHQLSLNKSLCVDHCHITGKVRGLLCNTCNIGLGKFNDDLDILQKAMSYLLTPTTLKNKFLIKGTKNLKKYKNPTKRQRILKKLYKMTLEDYENLLNFQNNSCAICQNSETYKCRINKVSKPLSVDHNHETGFVRGLLCDSCNSGLGLFKDSYLLIESAKKYLKNYVFIQ